MKRSNLKTFGLFLLAGLLAITAFTPAQATEKIVHTGMTDQEYQATFDDLVGQGFRLTYVKGYNLGDQPIYNATFEKRKGPAWQARHGLNESQFQQFNSELDEKGYQLLRHSRFEVGGQFLYAAIWEQR